MQVLALFIETAYVPESALRMALRLVDAALREEEESEGALRLVRSQAELDEALASGAVAGILSIEGAEPLGRDPGLVKVFERLGVRLIGPVWNRANAFADGVVEADGPGLTALGERLLAEMEELGIALDLSHLSPRGCERALAALRRHRARLALEQRLGVAKRPQRPGRAARRRSAGATASAG